MKSPDLVRHRALLITEYFLPHWTGISQAFFYLAQSLKNQGYDVTVLTTQFDPKLVREETIEGIPVVRTPAQFRLSRTYYSFAIIWKFLALLPHYDVVVINSPNSNILFFSVLAKLFGKKLAIYHQGDLTLPRQTGNIALHMVLEKIFDLFTISSFLLCDSVSSFTRDYAENSRVMKFALKKFRPYVPAFVHTNRPPSAEFKKKLDALAKNHILVGFAGRFVEEKGYDILLKAIPYVLDAYPEALFVFAGKKTIDYEPFFQKYQQLVAQQKKHLYFLGLLHKGDLDYFYSSLHVFVLSSRSDCFNITQVEAALSGVPLVVTDIPGARMLTKSTGVGEIVTPEDEHALADGIIKVLKNRKKYLQHMAEVSTFLHKYDTFKID